jgi:hypothetical protein
LLELRCKPGIVGIGCFRFNVEVFEEVVRLSQIDDFLFARSTGTEMQSDIGGLPFGKRPIYIVR